MPGMITVLEFVQACRAGKFAPLVQAYSHDSELLQAIALVGALEPLAASRPSVCDIVQTVERTVEVPPAPSADEPSRVSVIELCPGTATVLVVDFLRLKPKNLTAELSGLPEVKVSPIEMFAKNCLPFGEKPECGVFVNIEHFFVCPKGSVEIFALNCDPCSPALFTVDARLWETC